MESGQSVMQINKFASQALTTRNSNAMSNGPAEFTRRKNWSQNVLEELRDVIHVLSSDLNVLYCSPASREFLGYQPAELMGHSFSEYIHVDDVDIFSREFRTAQANGSIMRVIYRFLRKDGKYTTLETRGHFFKQGFFGSARSVPAEMTRMMDTFLDYKMENEILKRKVAIAKANASQGRAAPKQPMHQEPSPQETLTNTPGSSVRDDSVNNASFGENEFDDEEYEDDFEELFAPSANVYTQGVLNTYGVSESVSLFTGLHFDLGERSRGISMGLEGELFNTLVAPSIGEEGATINETENLRGGKKRRNNEDAVERICTDCGRTDAPEWRRGPRGPKTLCNACGLRWAKTNKSQGGDAHDMQD